MNNNFYYKPWFWIATLAGSLLIILGFIVAGRLNIVREEQNEKRTASEIIREEEQQISPGTFPGIEEERDAGQSNKFADWQNYQNNTLGFIMKYPEKWVISERSFETLPGLKVSIISFKNRDESPATSGYSRFEVIVWPMKAISDKSDLDLKLCNPKAQKVSEEQIAFEGISATRQRFKFVDTAYECIQLQKGDMAYEISTMVIHENPLIFLDTQKEEILDEILGTFRFIDPT